MVCVADEDDPRLDRNVLAELAIGIAGAVVALVAVPDDRPDFFEPVDRRDDPLAELGMLLDDLALLRRQRARLRQDRLGNADLPDVVEERTELQLLERARFEAEPLADLQCQVRDPAGV